MRHSGGGKPPPYGVEPIGTPGIDGLYRRRDTQVPPYAPCRQPVRVRRAAPVCAAAGRGFRLRSNADNSGTRYRAKWPPPSTPQGRRRGPWPAAGGCAICGWRWGRQRVSPAAAGGCFAPCEARPKALPLETAIWATRRRLARGVGEEFCVRARRSFAAILDVWQEAAPQLWRKRPGDARRHTGGKLPYRKKSSKTFICLCVGRGLCYR